MCVLFVFYDCSNDFYGLRTIRNVSGGKAPVILDIEAIGMTKREIIDGILQFNRSAAPEFLSKFKSVELAEYLDHLESARRTAAARGPSPWEGLYVSDMAPQYA